MLSKYVALYAANLIKENNTLKALDLFSRYGAPANPEVRAPSDLGNHGKYISANKKDISLQLVRLSALPFICVCKHPY